MSAPQHEVKDGHCHHRKDIFTFCSQLQWDGSRLRDFSGWLLFLFLPQGMRGLSNPRPHFMGLSGGREMAASIGCFWKTIERFPQYLAQYSNSLEHLHCTEIVWSPDRHISMDRRACHPTLSLYMLRWQISRSCCSLMYPSSLFLPSTAASHDLLHQASKSCSESEEAGDQDPNAQDHNP